MYLRPWILWLGIFPARAASASALTERPVISATSLRRYSRSVTSFFTAIYVKLHTESCEDMTDGLLHALADAELLLEEVHVDALSKFRA